MRNSVGYKNLIVWSKAAELRRYIYLLTQKFPKSEYRRVSQMNDAARSVKQNIQEGYPKSTLGLINSLSISQGSVNELEGDVDDSFEDELMTKAEFDKAKELCRKTDYFLSKLIESLRKKNSQSTRFSPFSQFSLFTYPNKIQKQIIKKTTCVIKPGRAGTLNCNLF